MKKIIIELNQTFEIEFTDEELQKLAEDGIDIENAKNVFDELGLEEIIYEELDLTANGYFDFEED